MKEEEKEEQVIMATTASAGNGDVEDIDDDDDGFCENYMVLKPKQGVIIDLFPLLYSSNIDKNSLVECRHQGRKRETEIDFEGRWLIFGSIVIQKALLLCSKPLYWFGVAFEMWLNLLSHNQNFGRLLLNFVQGKVMIPNRTSATFSSTVAILDKRVDLDEDIKPGDTRYYAALSIMAAKLAYENEAFVQRVVHDHWKMELLGFYNFWNEYQEKSTTQAFMLRDNTGDTEIIVVAFRGTECFDSNAWSTDFDISWYNLPNVGKVHGGFMKALGLQKKLGFPKEIDDAQGISRQFAYYAIREKLRQVLGENKEARFIVTGHSLGGALAALFPVVLAFHEEVELLERMEGVYTFGQPRVGDEKLGEYMKKEMEVHDVKYIRYVYGNDMVPRLPMDDAALMFKHFGTCIYYNSFYQRKIFNGVEEVPNKNYFSIWWVIPKMVNAVWELIRSFMIVYMMGADYEEGWFLRVIRLIGLVIPGVPAHVPQDYVNATRTVVHYRGIRSNKQQFVLTQMDALDS